MVCVCKKYFDFRLNQKLSNHFEQVHPQENIPYYQRHFFSILPRNVMSKTLQENAVNSMKLCQQLCSQEEKQILWFKHCRAADRSSSGPNLPQDAAGGIMEIIIS